MPLTDDLARANTECCVLLRHSGQSPLARNQIELQYKDKVGSVSKSAQCLLMIFGKRVLRTLDPSPAKRSGNRKLNQIQELERTDNARSMN